MYISLPTANGVARVRFSVVCHFVHGSTCTVPPPPNLCRAIATPTLVELGPHCTGSPFDMFKLVQSGQGPSPPPPTGSKLFTVKHELSASERLAFDWKAFLFVFFFPVCRLFYNMVVMPAPPIHGLFSRVTFMCEGYLVENLLIIYVIQ